MEGKDATEQNDNRQDHGFKSNLNSVSGLVAPRGRTTQTVPAVERDRALSVVRKCKSDVEAKLAYLFAGLFQNAPDALFEEMAKMGDQTALEKHFNIMRAVRVGCRLCSGEFFNLMNLTWVSLLNHQADGLPQAKGEAATLIAGYSQRNGLHYKVILEEVRGRFTHLVGEDVSWHPFLPTNLYLCFWHASERLDVTYDERLVLLRIFHRFVMDRYGQLLFVVNDRLSSSGIVYRQPGLS